MSLSTCYCCNSALEHTEQTGDWCQGCADFFSEPQPAPAPRPAVAAHFSHSFVPKPAKNELVAWPLGTTAVSLLLWSIGLALGALALAFLAALLNEATDGVALALLYPAALSAFVACLLHFDGLCLLPTVPRASGARPLALGALVCDGLYMLLNLGLAAVAVAGRQGRPLAADGVLALILGGAGLLLGTGGLVSFCLFFGAVARYYRDETLGQQFLLYLGSVFTGAVIGSLGIACLFAAVASPGGRDSVVYAGTLLVLVLLVIVGGFFCLTMVLWPFSLLLRVRRVLAGVDEAEERRVRGRAGDRVAA